MDNEDRQNEDISVFIISSEDCSKEKQIKFGDFLKKKESISTFGKMLKASIVKTNGTRYLSKICI